MRAEAPSARRPGRSPATGLAGVRCAGSTMTAAGWLLGLALLLGALPATGVELDLRDTSRLQIGVGDRYSIERHGRWVPTLTALDQLGIRVDMLQIWLPRGWKKDWISRKALAEVHRRGVVPVVVHYFFGDDISKERVEAQRDAWYASMWEMAQQIRGDDAVLVILEPEFNIAPPKGETAITDWPWFANDLRAAADMIRREAPNALIGTCPGDFPGTPSLEPVLGPVADDLDFIAFQEMRAASDRDAGRPGYKQVGRASIDYARYLKRAFGRPLLLGYLAISSQGGWVETQKQMLAGVDAQRNALRAAGVFGVIYFQLYDDPAHAGYFGPAEKHFGLLTHEGRAKPALEVFRAMSRHGRPQKAAMPPAKTPGDGSAAAK